MKQQVNSSYIQLFKEKPRYFILMGGRGGGRSTVASQFANAKLISPEYFRCAMMRYILGDIRNSIYKEIVDRAEENGIKDKLSINDGLMTVEYGKNGIYAFGFRKSSGDQKAKLKSLANFNCVIIEEGDEIPEADFLQLDDSLRTIKGDVTVIILLNPPPKDHWIINRWFDLIPVEGVNGFFNPVLKKDIKDTVFIQTSYLDNIKNISAQSITNYENYKNTKPSHYWNMIKGLVPEVVKGKIYTGWNQIGSIPPEAKLVRRGLDYGYTNDPSAIIDIYKWNDAWIWDEVLYKKGMSNKQLADVILAQPDPNVLVIPDSSEPKSNDELISYDIAVLPANKGQGSVSQGIQYVQSQKIFVTTRSINIWKEYLTYAWIVDKDGKTLNEPKPGNDHAMDSGRYAMESSKPVDIVSEEDRAKTHIESRRNLASNSR